MREKYLIGATKDNEIVFADFGIETRNGYPEFVASFDTVRPFNEEDAESAEDYYERLIDEMDAQWCWDKVQLYDCAPSELATYLAWEEEADIQDIYDCSLYPEIIDVDGVNYYFESSACGQHDTRKDMRFYTSKNLYNKLHELWDAYHLKRVSQEVIDEVQQLKRDLNTAVPNEKAWIRKYIRKLRSENE